MYAVFRAVFGYLFLVLMVRVVGRRPGKQMAPFDFVLIFFIGGLTLTAMVADDNSLTNAFVQIVTVAVTHYALTLLRRKSKRFALFLDGTPLVLRGGGRWAEETLRKENFSKDDVLSAIRENGSKGPEEVDWAVLERSGGISVIPSEKGQG